MKKLSLEEKQKRWSSKGGKVSWANLSEEQRREKIAMITKRSLEARRKKKETQR